MAGVRYKYEIDRREVYKVSEVAAMLDTDMRRVYAHLAKGTLLAIDISPPGSPRATWRITRQSLNAFLAEAEHKARRGYRLRLPRVGRSLLSPLVEELQAG